MKLDVIYNEDCLVGIKRLLGESIDLIACDPQYGWSFMGKDWDKAVPSTDIWRQCFRVLKPGAFAFIMSGPRLDCLIENGMRIRQAGFTISFTPIFWCFASGFPKAQNIGKAVDKRLGVEREVIGRNPNSRENCDKSNTLYESGTVGKTANITFPTTPQAKALNGSYGGFQPKPAVEIIIVAMKPLSEKTYVDQALKNKKGITWLGEGRIPYRQQDWQNRQSREGKSIGTSKFAGSKIGNVNHSEQLNNQGRFPANLLVSDDVLNDGKIRYCPVTKGITTGGKAFWHKEKPTGYKSGFPDSGSFSRYFSLDSWWEKKIKELPIGVQKTFPFLICAKAGKAEKNRGLETLVDKPSVSNTIGFDETKRNRQPRNCQLKNYHPTVKPIKLMSYLITLGSREGDIILDPFIGSGTTAIAAKMFGRHYIGFEINPEYCEIAKARLEAEKTLWD